MPIEKRRDRMKLGAFFHPTGNHIAAWLHPSAQIDAGTNFQHYVLLAQMAEAAKFDLMFLADAVATRDGNLEALSRWPQYMAYFDPLTLLAGIAAVTHRLGLVATMTTSYNEPYTVARRFASLDLMSKGRTGWNIVTSSNESEAFNFGRDAHFGHAERYERADEFTEVVKGLWDSYDDDAFVRDRQNARYFDPAKLHYLNHKGKHFTVRGPLNAARPVQGYPVLVQATASMTGREMAARTAELLFSPLNSLNDAQQFYGDIKQRCLKYGRSPDHIKVMPGLNVIVGRSEKEALEKQEYLNSLIHPDVGKELLSHELGGLDLSTHDIERPIADEVVERILQREKRSHSGLLADAARTRPTLRDLYQAYGGARGQRTLVGSPEQVADSMEEWFVQRGVDGFLIQPAHLPDGLHEFISHVIPILRERGLFREEYEGETLRENLGLPRPASHYEKSA